MKRATCLLSIFLLIGSYPAATQTQSHPVWQPAHFRNLVVGQSTTRQIIAELGRPKYVGKEDDTLTPMWTYEVQEPFPGFLYVYPLRGRLKGLTLGLKSSVGKDEVVRLYGTRYHIVRYDFDDCLGRGGTAPVYQSPNGQIERMEFPESGISVSLNGNQVQELVFTDRPTGPAHSRCLSKQPPPAPSRPPGARQPSTGASAP